MRRRTFIGGSAATTAAAASLPFVLGKEDSLIDTNVYLGEYPFRELSRSGVEALSATMQEIGVTEAWAGSFDGIKKEGLAKTNELLAKQCENTLLRPFAAVNPTQADWKTTLTAATDLGCPGIRLHPNYHGYRLDHPEFVNLLAQASEQKLVVQIVMRLEDPRTHPVESAVPDVDFKPLITTMRQDLNARVQILNGLRSSRDSLTLKRLGELGVTFEIAMLEGIEGLRNHFDTFPGLAVAFGSHSPFFYAQASQLKLTESQLSEGETEAVRFQTARQLLAAA